MKLVVITSNRSPRRLDETLATMALSGDVESLGKITLLVARDHVAAMTPFRHLSRIQVTTVPVHAEALNPEALPRDRFRWRLIASTCAALRMGVGDEMLCVIEDDVRFRDDWVAIASKAYQGLVQKHGSRFFLSGYAAYRFGPAGVASYPASKYYGNQMMIVHPEMGKVIADEIERAGARGHVTDIAIARYCERESVPVYAIVPSLVQHTGASSESKNPEHQSPMWEFPS